MLVLKLCRVNGQFLKYVVLNMFSELFYIMFIFKMSCNFTLDCQNKNKKKKNKIHNKTPNTTKYASSRQMNTLNLIWFYQIDFTNIILKTHWAIVLLKYLFLKLHLLFLSIFLNKLIISIIDLVYTCSPLIYVFSKKYLTFEKTY